MKLSVIIVTKNEEENIVSCLESVKFADEIIIYDSGSTDKTVELAKKYTDKIQVTPDWPGDGPQKIRALKSTTHDWVLVLDADEQVTKKLQLEIQQAIKNNNFVAYDIPFISHYLGKAIKFGDWRGESHIRLFNKNNATISSDIVHCHIEYKGKLGKFKNKIAHYPYNSLEKVLHKLNDYSTNSANKKFTQGKKSGVIGAIIRALWTFINGYIFKLGFLDGKYGFILAMSNSHGCYYRYLKLMLLNNKK